jgi:ADP-ribosylglycohydrolase
MIEPGTRSEEKETTVTISGSLFGLAYGDAMGKPTEFVSYAVLKRVYDKYGPRTLPLGNYTIGMKYAEKGFIQESIDDYDAWLSAILSDDEPMTGKKYKKHARAFKPISYDPNIARVTDDTQMAIAVANAITRVARNEYFIPSNVTLRLEQEFVDWYLSPENTSDRAAGGTCMTAAAGLHRGLPWWDCTGLNKKGCGANMRVTPIGLCDWLTPEQRSGAAQLQAAITHWHPTALAASDVTQQAVHLLLHGADPDDLLDLLLDYITVASRWDSREWVGDTLDDTGKLVGPDSTRRWMGKGWFETRQAILKVRKAWKSSIKVNYASDPCLVGGDGWIAEEALATALHCFLMFPEDGAAVVGRGAMTSGDSDSIAALAGAFAGAHLGLDGFPAEWQNQIEYADVLRGLADKLS